MPGIFSFLTLIFSKGGLTDHRILCALQDAQLFLDALEDNQDIDNSESFFCRDHFLDTRNWIASSLGKSYGHAAEKEFLAIPYLNLEAQRDFVCKKIKEKSGIQIVFVSVDID